MKLRIPKGLLVVILGAPLLLNARTSSAVVVVPPRTGQVGLGAQIQYGTLFDTDGLGQDYEAGPGLAVRLRYRMRYERAIGLSFENQGFDTRGDVPSDVEGLSPPERLHFFTAGPEVYQMFGTAGRTHKMLSLGAGLAKITVKLQNGETAFLTAGDGLYVSAGAGLEHFFYRSWGLDMSTRYMAVFHDGKANHDVQLSIGLMFYASY